MHYDIAIRSHFMIWKYVWNFIFATKFNRIFLLYGKHSFGKGINEVWNQACDLMRFIQQTHIYILQQTHEHYLSHCDWGPIWQKVYKLLTEILQNLYLMLLLF